MKKLYLKMIRTKEATLYTFGRLKRISYQGGIVRDKQGVLEP